MHTREECSLESGNQYIFSRTTLNSRTYLENSNEETISHQLPKSLGPILQQREDAPSELEGRDRPVHRKHRKEKRKR